MAIQIGGTTVIDNNRNINAGIATFTQVNLPPVPFTLNPTDGATGIGTTSNIVINFNAPVAIGTGNITLRSVSAGGTALQTIAVGSTSVTISGGQVTIDPPSNLPFFTDTYVVVDAGAFTSYLGTGNAIINTYNFTTADSPPTVSSFSPTDGSIGQSVSTNIVITFSTNVSKGTGNITLRSTSAGGTILQTIAVSSGSVTIVGAVVTIDPPSDLPFSTDVYVVVDQGAFVTAGGGQSALINTYNFNTLGLGSSYEGGFLICQSAGVRWVVAPSSSQVVRDWYTRNDANTRAQQVSGCTGWFVPTCGQLQNPGNTCRTYWDSYCLSYWSSSIVSGGTGCKAINVYLRTYNCCAPGSTQNSYVTGGFYVRSFRCVTY